jgi:hypothetical protein
MLTVFVGLTTLAILLQMLILAGMFVSLRKTAASVTAMQSKLNDQVLPLVARIRTLVDESGPDVQLTLANLAETSVLLRAQAVKIDAAVTGVVEVARTQAQAAGEVAARTMDRVDQTAHAVQSAVITPVRHISALLQGIVVGFGDFTGRRKVQRTTQAKAAARDEMFI